MRHHCPIKYCIPNQFSIEITKLSIKVKVHTVIDRCRFVVTHWNKCVTLKLFSRKCNSWWWYFNKSQWRWLLQCIEFSQGSWLSAKQPSISASPRQSFERGQEPDAVWLCLSFPCEKNQFFPHAFALRYSNFKAFSFRNAKDVNFKFRYEYNNELTFSW